MFINIALHFDQQVGSSTEHRSPRFGSKKNLISLISNYSALVWSTNYNDQASSFSRSLRSQTNLRGLTKLRVKREGVCCFKQLV